MTSSAVPAVLPHGKQEETPQWQVLLEKASKAIQTGDIIIAPTYDFYPLPNQPRSYFGPASMARMADSIRGPLGQMYEGIARLAPPGSPAKYQIIDGERRWRGARMAEKPYRARIIKIDDESLPYILAAVANFNREGHSVPEVVNTIDYFLKMGMPWTEVARMLGYTITWTQKLHTLKGLRDEVWDMLDPNRVKSDILPLMAAFEIAKMHKEHQLAIAQRVLTHKLTTAAVKDETTKLAKQLGLSVGAKRAPRKTWRSVHNRCGVLERTAQDLNLALNDESMDEILMSRPEGQVLNLLLQLEVARKGIEKAEKLLREKCAPPTKAEK